MPVGLDADNQLREMSEFEVVACDISRLAARFRTLSEKWKMGEVPAPNEVRMQLTEFLEVNGRLEPFLGTCLEADLLSTAVTRTINLLAITAGTMGL